MKHLLLLSMLCLHWACQRPAATTPPPAAKDEHSEDHTEVATRWTNQTELFVEYPPLVAGETSRFAIHFTRLDNFRAVSRGFAEVRLDQPGQAPEVFRADAPSRPGIFGINVKPARAGQPRLRITFSGEGITDTHDLGPAPVAANRAAAAHPPEEEATDAITFLKEQQWTLDFATAPVAAKSLQASLRVPAEVTPRSGGFAEVDAPFDGRLLLPRVPVVGAKVQAGDVLARLLLPVNNPNDLPGLELARQEATALLQLARQDHARTTRLSQSGAIPARRLEEATAALTTAEARLQAAQARLAQYEESLRASSDSSTAKSFAIKSPITGLLDAVKTSPGSNVKAGDSLFQIVDLDQVFVSAIVPESEFPRMTTLSGAELEIPGQPQPRRLTDLVTIGRVVDAPSRTFPVIYRLDNRARLVAVNQTVYVRLLFASTAPTPAVPESAIVDDAGQPIVFLQLGGESFARRAVKLGQRSGAFVQVLEGLRPGDRIVTQGAHLIRLAAMSNQVPAHGHVH